MPTFGLRERKIKTLHAFWPRVAEVGLVDRYCHGEPLPVSKVGGGQFAIDALPAQRMALSRWPRRRQRQKLRRHPDPVTVPDVTYRINDDSGLESWPAPPSSPSAPLSSSPMPETTTWLRRLVSLVPRLLAREPTRWHGSRHMPSFRTTLQRRRRSSAWGLSLLTHKVSDRKGVSTPCTVTN